MGKKRRRKSQPVGERGAALVDDMDALTTAEVVLLQMGAKIPDPLTQTTHGALYTSLVGHRSVSLYPNFLHSLGSPADIAPLLALRPLVEAAILAKWISLDPKLHGELWFAQSEDRDITAIREQEKHLGISVQTGTPTELITESIDEKTAWRDEAIKHGKAAGKRYGDRAMPSLDRLVKEIEDQDPGHKIAMRQAYDVAYRSISPWTHTEAASFKYTAVQTDDGLAFVGDRSPYRAELLRMIAGAMFAYVLEVAGAATGAVDAVDARFIRDYLTVYHRPADSQGPAEEPDSA